MNMKHNGLLLGATLVVAGCQATPNLYSNVLKAVEPTSVNTPASAASTTPAFSSTLPKVDVTLPPSVVNNKSEVRIAIRWPERTTQAIPNSANTVRVRIYKQNPAEGELDLCKELIDRSEGALVNRSYWLEENTPFRIEVKVYSELKANVEAATFGDALTDIASGISDIPALAAKTTHPLTLTLVPRYIPTVNPADYIAGSNAQFKITGQGFGANKDQIEVFYKDSNSNLTAIASSSILAVDDGNITFKAPSNLYGAGELVVKRDGIVATGGPITFAPLSAINTPNLQTIPSMKQGQWEGTISGYKFYAVVGATFSLPVQGYYYAPSYTTTENFVHNITVKDADNGDADVTANVVNSETGVLSLPAEHHYKVKVNSGSVASTEVHVYGASIGPSWNIAEAPICDIPTAPYYLTNTINTYSNTAGVVPLTADRILVSGSDIIHLTGADFNWTYSPNNVVTIDTNFTEPDKARFKAGTTIGTATVTGTLKYAPNYTVSAAVSNVKLASMDVAYDAAYVPGQYNAENWQSIPGNAFALAVGEKKKVRIQSFTYTGGDPLTPDWTFKEALTWVSRTQDNQLSATAFASVTQDVSDKGLAIIEAKSAGTAYIRLKFTSDTDSTKNVVIPVTVTP